MKFKSEIGFLPFLVALLPIFTIMINWFVLYFSHSEIDNAFFYNLLICLIIGGLNTCLLVGFSYTITQDEILIKGLFYTKSIPIESIYKIEEVKNYIFDPAASSNRIQIAYNTNEIIHISPRKKQQFITLLTESNRKILVKNQ